MKLQLVRTCPERMEEMEPSEEAIACPNCGCEVTPGKEHPPCDERLCVLGLDEVEEQ